MQSGRNIGNSHDHVSLGVQRQVVGSGEGAIAHLALEWPIPCVLPRVPGQLVRPGKAPPASLEAADVGLLPCVRPQVRLQMAGFGIGLIAVLVRAVVYDGLSLRPGPFFPGLRRRARPLCPSRPLGLRRHDQGLSGHLRHLVGGAQVLVVGLSCRRRLLESFVG